ncbi:MAG: MoaD/ThiS family protein [Promethearchaeota archaeon]
MVFCKGRGHLKKGWKMTEKMLSVTVKLFAGLQNFSPRKTVINLLENSSIKSILNKYKIPEEQNIIILLNGKPHAKLNFILKDGDIVASENAIVLSNYIYVIPSTAFFTLMASTIEFFVYFPKIRYEYI